MAKLAIDTCFAACSVAIDARGVSRVGSQSKSIVSIYEAMAIGHAERLIPMIGEALDAAGLRPADIDDVRVTRGPGSFTGVRVGLAAARAFVLANRCRIAGTTSLHVMAAVARERLAEAERDLPIIVAVETRDRMLYTQLFSGFDALSPAMLSSAETAAAALDDQPLIAVGSGARALADAARWFGRDLAADLEDLLPDARLLLALDLPAQRSVEPLYLRDADAKPQADAALERA